MRLGAFLPRPRLISISLALLLAALAPFVLGSTNPEAATYTVTNTDDSGTGSLRWAITQANGNAGTDSIFFDILGVGPHAIQPASTLPAVTDAVVIDGYTESGSSPAIGTGPAVLMVEVDGTVAGGSAHGLQITAGGSTVRGLTINRFSGCGIEVGGNGGNLIEGNHIGTDVDGVVDAGNAWNGIRITDASNNTIGGITAASRNVISGNGESGVVISGSLASGNAVRGCYIGVDASATAGLGNGMRGVHITEAPDNTVGGIDPGARNVISGNAYDGIRISGNASGNLVQGNYIGTGVDGIIDLGNAETGIRIENGSDNTVGGTDASARNVISGNQDQGIRISGSAASANLVQGNYVGTDATGTAAVGNSKTGVVVLDAWDNTIGGATAGAANVISGNAYNGVWIGGGTATGNVVQGNLIGTDESGASDLGNAISGIRIQSSASGNTVGGTGSGEANLIAYNDSNGVCVLSGSGNAVLSNSIFLNDSLGIDLGGDGVTPNDVGDGDTGPNDLQNFPVLTMALAAGASTIIQGTLNSWANTTFYLEFFSNSSADPSGYGEGETWVDSTTVTTDGSGNASFSITVSPPVPVGYYVCATATDPSGNTSELSEAVSVADPLVVTNVSDSGLGSLREAILHANAHAGTDTITFDIPGAGPHTIQPTSALPTVADTVVIDGYTQAGAQANTVPAPGLSDAVLKIELDGSSAGSADGLRIAAGGSTVRGLVVNRFGSSGVLLQASGAAVEGNYIGTDVSGASVLSNGGYGVQIGGSCDNTIGGVAPGSRNIISGNSKGIAILGNALRTVVQGNYIGTDAAGTTALGNIADGIHIDHSFFSTIGGSTPGARNIISGNGWCGVFCDITLDTSIRGNYIGTDVTGTADLGNGRDGVLCNSVRDSVGGLASGEPNVIAYNGRSGVCLELGDMLGENAVLSNSIFSNDSLGIDLGGDGVTPNDVGDGDTGPNNLQNFPVLTMAISVGGSTIIQGTLNSMANTTFYLEFFSNSAADPSGYGEGETWVDSATVTTDASGNASFSISVSPPVPVGYYVCATATDPYGNTSEFGEVITVEALSLVVTNANDSGAGSLRQAILAANVHAGPDTITFDIPGAGPHTIQPTSALPTAIDTLVIDGYTQPGAQANTVPAPGLSDAVLKIELDGSSAGSVDGLRIAADGCTVRGLVINHFGGAGIQIFQADAAVVEGNYIGTDVGGSAVLGNAAGVWIDGDWSAFCYDNTIGGTAPGARNVISGNGEGIVITQYGERTVVQGNYVGTDVTGTAGLGNTGHGMRVSDSGFGIIGGSAPWARNIISGNGGDGIFGDIMYWIPIQGNYIGTDVTGTTDLGNGGHGIHLVFSNNNSVGGTASGEPNVVAYNGNSGVCIELELCAGNAVLSNSIFSNDSLGIDLGGDGVTPNDAGDGDTGANDLQNFPVLTMAMATGASTSIQGTLNSTANTSFYLEFFSNSVADPSGYGEGETWMDSTTVTTDGSGNASFSVTVSPPVPVGYYVCATATDPSDNTSEFGEVVTVEALSLLVTNTNDSGAGSLRQAILAANAHAGPDTITFDIPGAGPHTIHVASALPTVTDTLVIDGYTQLGAQANTVPAPGASDAVLKIELDGSSAGSVDGLRITADGCTVRGLVINRFGGSGIQIFQADGALIEGNYIGTDVSGGTVLGNGGYGVQIDGDWTACYDNTVGGVAPGARNIISGNSKGIAIIWGPERTVIQGNYIGTDVAGSTALGNTTDGIYVSDAHFGTIGGSTPGARNIISGNGWCGIFCDIMLETAIQGNYIGTDATGTADLSNGGHGVHLTCTSSGDSIGGLASGEPNVIAYNGNSGVCIDEYLCTENAILSNSIFSNDSLGIDLGGDGVTPNDTGDGDTGANDRQNFPVLTMAITGSVATIIQGTLNSTANTTFYLELFSNSAADPSGHGEGETWVDSTSVTTDGSGDASFSVAMSPPVPVGYYVCATATDPNGNTSEFGPVQTVSLVVTNTNDSGAGSLREAILAANAHAGIDTITFDIPGAGPHTIHLTSALPTVTDTLVIDGYTQPGAQANTVPAPGASDAVLKIELDGTSAGSVDGLRLGAGGCTVRGLVINRFGGTGVWIGASGRNAVQGNYIGTDVTGTADLGNSFGVEINTGGSNTIGGTAEGARNVISGNGIGMIIVGTDGDVIQGNYIGTDVTGAADLGNGTAVYLLVGEDITVGGAVAGACNVISGNDGHGILLELVGGTAIQGNRIGTDASGSNDLGNSGHGVYIHDSDNNTVGGAGTGECNIIAYNGGDGVYVFSDILPTAPRNGILSNSIFSNAGLGIDLSPDGATPNDTGDGDTGANDLQNFPVLTWVGCSGTHTQIQGTLNSMPGKAYRLEFFSSGVADPSGYGEGATYLGSTTVVTDGAGDAGFDVTLHVPVAGGCYVTATATDPNNNTSEFSEWAFVMAATGTLVGGELQITWPPFTRTAEYWVYGAVNEAYFEPQLTPPYQYRIATLPGTTTMWSTTNGVADPDSNWTYVIIAVDIAGQELVRSNACGDHDFDTSATQVSTASAWPVGRSPRKPR